MADLAARRAEGLAHVQAHRYDEAIRCFGAILEEAPEDGHSLDLLGFLFYMSGRFADARDACERALALRPDHYYAEKGLGLCLAALGEVEAGVAHLRRSIELNPAYFDSRHDLGVTLLKAGRVDEARQVFLEARRVAPGRAAEIDRILARLPGTPR